METEIGPVEYMIVSFPGNQFKGEIAPALAKLVEANTIRDHRPRVRRARTPTARIVVFELSDLEPTRSGAASRLSASRAAGSSARKT